MMIRIILILLTCFWSIAAFPCMNFIPESEAIKAIAMVPNAGQIRCKSLPNEPCLCFDGIDWETAIYKDVQEDDVERPIYAVENNVIGCASREACQEIVETKCPTEEGNCLPGEQIHYCTAPDSAFIRPVGLAFEAYCTHIIGYEQKTVKRLMEDPIKKAAKDARVLAEQQAEETKKTRNQILRARLAQLSIKDDLTAAEIKESLIKLLKFNFLN